MKLRGKLYLSLRGFSRSNPVDNNSLLDRVAPLAMTKGIMLAITALIALAGGGLLFVDTPTLADNPETITVSAEIEPALKLEISNCDLAQVDETKLKIPDVAPTQGFSSTCQTLSISTNRPGYELTAKVSSTNPNYNSNNPTNDLLYTDATTKNPIPAIPMTNSPMTNPTTLTPNSWGFAITSNNSTLATASPLSNFDGPNNYYYKEPTTKYANLPTTDTQIYQTDQDTTQDDEFEFYYAVAINTTQAAGTYASRITYSVVGEIVPCPWDSLISFDDANCADPKKVDFTVANGSTGTVERDINMIPVKYTGDSANPEWSKADPTNQSNDWFDYDNQRWANVVTVKPTALDSYKHAAVGTPIPEADILGYFVYIPRYQYQVQRFNPSDSPSCGPAATNNPGAVTGTCSTTLNQGLYGPRNFNIKFQKAADQIFTPGAVGDWATHPAFEFTSGGTTYHLNGLWVGKFEATGAQGALTIKPNQTSLREQTISLQYDQAKRIGAVDPIAESYGGGSYLNNAGASAIPQNQHNLTTAKTHDLTNKDWGAVIYLATSIYGAGDTTYANGNSKNEYGVVGKNANSDYVTGCGRYDSQSDASSYAGGTTCKRTTDHDRSYFSAVGIESSTTSNVYGVYDMVGGAFEYTMSNYGSTNLNAGFDTLPAGSYINIYTQASNSYTGFDNCTWDLCGGQGLYETTFVVSVSGNYQSWSRDNSSFAYSSYPWARRGGAYSDTSDAGLFNSSIGSSTAFDYNGFRVGAAIW